MTQFIPFSRDRACLLPPEAKDWLPADDVAHFVAEAVDRVPLGAFAVRPIPGGRAQYHPRLLLAREAGLLRRGDGGDLRHQARRQSLRIRSVCYDCPKQLREKLAAEPKATPAGRYTVAIDNLGSHKVKGVRAHAVEVALRRSR